MDTTWHGWVELDFIQHCSIPVIHMIGWESSPDTEWLTRCVDCIATRWIWWRLSIKISDQRSIPRGIMLLSMISLSVWFCDFTRNFPEGWAWWLTWLSDTNWETFLAAIIVFGFGFLLSSFNLTELKMQKLLYTSDLQINFRQCLNVGDRLRSRSWLVAWKSWHQSYQW